MKPYVLIVEDEAILYERLSQALLKEHFEVSDYIKSYDEAIESISEKRPDIALLDINLQDKKDGLDLGRVLNKKYNIPFIYITDLDDDRIFNKGLQTNHQQFIVKTKPKLNIKEIVRAIDTVLNKQEKEPFKKEYIFGLTETLQKIKKSKGGFISKVPIAYKDIVFFSTENVDKNYCKINTKTGKAYLLKYTLNKIACIAPNYFVRISDCYILNISPEYIDGRICGSTISVLGKEYIISSTYRIEVEKRFNKLYDKPS